MRLLKLVSDKDLEESVFTNSLSFPLTIKKGGSMVALKNLSLQFNEPKYEVTDLNNTFKFKTSVTTSPLHTVVLSNGSYSLADLMEEITKKMNNILNSIALSGAGSADTFLQWRVSKIDEVNGNANLKIEYKRRDPVTITQATSKYENMDFTSTPNINKLSTAPNDGTFNAVLMGEKLVSNGGLITNITISNQDTTNITTSNWVWGIDKDAESYEKTTRAEIVALMYACVGNSNGKYAYKKAGVMVETTLAITIDDILKINKNNGKIQYVITRGSNNTTFEGDVINDVIPNLGLDRLRNVLHIGDDTGKIAFKTPQLIPNPYVEVPLNGVYIISDPANSQNVYSNSNLTAVPSNVKQFLYFETVGVKRLLGFSRSEYSQSGPDGSFVGDYGLAINVIDNDLEIEIVELPLNNYSHTYKQLRPLVMTISSSDLHNSIIATGVERYELSWQETASWVWLTLDNLEYDFRVPALTVRITSRGELVKMKGPATCTLLIKDPSENS
jgi:hypothetical protein